MLKGTAIGRRQEGENMNRGIVWTLTLVNILDYIQM
jgi:hypothetical protein